MSERLRTAGGVPPLHPLGTARQRLAPAPALPAAAAAALADADLGEEAAFLAWQVGEWAGRRGRRRRARRWSRRWPRRWWPSPRAAPGWRWRRRARGRWPACPSWSGAPGDRTPFILDGGYLYQQRHHASEQRIAEAIARRRPGGGSAWRGGRRRSAALAAVVATARARAQRRAAGGGARGAGRPPGGDHRRPRAPARPPSWSPCCGRWCAWACRPRRSPSPRPPARPPTAWTRRSRPAPRRWRARRARRRSAAAAAPARRRDPAPPAGLFARAPARSPTTSGSPLPHRVVIVDESSMIDLLLMDRLLRGAAPRGRRWCCWATPTSCPRWTPGRCSAIWPRWACA